MQLDQATEYETVYTVEFPGIYVLVLRLQTGGSGNVRTNGLSFLSANGIGQGSAIRYLEAGQLLEYQGPAGELFGVRIGTEI